MGTPVPGLRGKRRMGETEPFYIRAPFPLTVWTIGKMDLIIYNPEMFGSLPSNPHEYWKNKMATLGNVTYNLVLLIVYTPKYVRYWK